MAMKLQWTEKAIRDFLQVKKVSLTGNTNMLKVVA